MIHRTLLTTAAFVLIFSTTSAAFEGWQGMRIIHQDGRPDTLQTGDVDGDGRDELIVVNKEQSRLDLYGWLPLDKRTDEYDESTIDEGRPNDLPMPADLYHVEIALEHLPHAVELTDLEGDGKPELVVLVAPPNKVLIYSQDESGVWQQQTSIDLLAGEFSPRHQPLLVHRNTKRVPEMLIGTSSGIQRLDLASDARPTWLTPREKQGRIDWWLADLDGDSDQDLVERLIDSDKSVRWFQRASSGHLMPAQVLYDRAIEDAGVLYRPTGADQLLLLDGATEGLLRCYTLALGKASSLGQRRPLAVQGGEKAIWCGLQIDSQPAIVVADRNRPQLLVHHLEENGWGTQQSFPGIASVKGIAAVPAKPGTLLIWADDVADLYVSRWEHGRLTFPAPFLPENETDQRQIIALESVGRTAWWVQQAGRDCDLYVWGPDDSKPHRTRFKGINFKQGAQAKWLGGRRLLLRRTYRDSPELAVHDGENISVTAPAHVKKTKIDELQVVDVGGEIRVAQRGDGVLQWLSGDLRPVDQLMLPQDRRLASYAAGGKTRGWALQQGGQYLHLLTTDKAGIPQIEDSARMDGGVLLVADPVLGLILVDNDRIEHVAAGRPMELKMVSSVDGRVVRRSGVKKSTIHRIGCLDIDGDATWEALLMDDQRHQLSVLFADGDNLTSKISWPVFEDKKYPYGDGDEALAVAEPRTVVALDVDGDNRQDLAMACHDRIIFYLSHDEP